MRFPDSFLWGTATAAHQVEGGNALNDIWLAERTSGSLFHEPSGDACDSFHRYGEDIELVAAAGLGAYRFSLDWGRIQPAAGEVSRASLDHYRRMVDTCREAGVAPVVTVHHFASPQWLARAGGWGTPEVVDHFGRFCEIVAPVLRDVGLVCTINEPNVMLDFAALLAVPVSTTPVALIRDNIIAAHQRAVQVLKQGLTCEVGLTLAIPALVVLEGGEAKAQDVVFDTVDVYLDAVAEDDFVGVQTYTDLVVGPDGVVDPQADDPDVLAQMGWRYRPEALGDAVRRTFERTGKPIYVTENGIATDDDAQRQQFIQRALTSLHAAMTAGVDVRGYFYWSLLDNFEWLKGYEPTFGLAAVDRQSFRRTAKPSLQWFGNVARSGWLEPA